MNWHKYDSPIDGETTGEKANNKLLVLFINDSERYELSKPLLDEKYISVLEMKKEKCDKLLQDLIEAEAPDGTKSDDFTVIKQEYFDKSIEFSNILKEKINLQLEELLKRGNS